MSEPLAATAVPRRLPAPLLPVAVGLIAGISLDSYASPGVWTCVLVALSAALVAGFAAKRSGLAWLAVVVAAVAVGAMRHDLAFRSIPPRHVARYLDPGRRPLLTALRGRVLTPPKIIEPREDIPRAYAFGPKTRFLIRATRLAGVNEPIAVTGTVQVAVKAPMPNLREGDLIELTGWLYRPRPPANPGQYDWSLALRRSGILALMSCDHAEGVHVLERAASPGLLTRLRAHARALLHEEALLADDPAAGVLEAMVLGQRSAVSRAMNEVFVRTGNVHFLAASGVNVAWLAAFGWGITRLFGMYYRRAAAVVAFIIVSFMLVAEPEPSILRAGLMGLLACLGVLVRGRLNVLNWLACSAIAILLLDPCDLFRPGFQLSFTGVLAVSHFTGVIRDIAQNTWSRLLTTFRRATGIPQTVPALLQASADTRSRWSNGDPVNLKGAILFVAARFRRLAVLSLCATVAAWVIAAPLAAFHFAIFAPWGILGTLLLSPFAMVVTFVGYAKLVLAVLFPPSNLVAGPILAACTAAMIEIINQLAKLPGTTQLASTPSAAWLLATYGLFAMRTYRPASMPVPRGYPALAVLLLLGWTLPPGMFSTRHDALRIWMLAVGDGTATVIEMPNGRTWLYDFGTRSPFDAGQVGLDFLRWRGIRRIDTAIVSHSDFDHFSGIDGIAETIPIDRVAINDQFLIGLGERSAAAQFVKGIQALRVPIESITGSHRFPDTGDVIVEAIWPPAATVRRLTADNDRSMVLRVSFHGRTILLTGDITETAMNALVADPRLSADVLALPHHGSVVATTQRFINAVNPQYAIRSTSQSRWMTTNNIERLVGDRRYFSTADDGCICITFHKDRLDVQTVMNPSRSR